MAFEFNDLKGLLFLVLLIVPLTSSTNINCRGKPFHCLNSTHFMICADLGGGVSCTIDDFVIQCPPPTVCHANNIFECEFPKVEEQLLVIGVSKANDDTTPSPLVTSTATSIGNRAGNDLKEPNEKKNDTVLSQPEPIKAPLPEDVLEDLKEEFLERNEKFFDLPTIMQTSTVRYTTENIVPANTANAFERSTTDQNIFSTTTVTPSTVFVVENTEINNTTVIYNTEYVNNETKILPADINYNASRNKTHKEDSNFSSNRQPIDINNTTYQSEYTANKINKTTSNTTVFDGSSNVTAKNINEENELKESPLQISSTTVLPLIITNQIELGKPPDIAPSKQFHHLPPNQNLSSTRAMLNGVTEATLFKNDTSLKKSTGHGEPITVTHNSLPQTLQNPNMLDSNVPTTEITKVVSGLFDNSEQIAKQINISALPVPTERIPALTDLNSTFPNNTELSNNNLVITERNLDGSTSLLDKNIEVSTVPYTDKVINEPGIPSSVGRKSTNNSITTDLPIDQVLDHNSRSPGISVQVKNEAINNSYIINSTANNIVELNVNLSSSLTTKKNEDIHKTTTTEHYGSFSPIEYKGNGTKNSTTSSDIQLLIERNNGLSPSTLISVQKSEAINKTDNKSVDVFLTVTSTNFTTVMTEDTASGAPQGIMPEYITILPENLRLNKTSNDIGEDSISSKIQPRTLNNAIVEGENNSNSNNDMIKNTPSVTSITNDTFLYSDNIDNSIKLPDEINRKLDMNLGNPSTSNNLTDLLSDNISNVIIDPRNNTKPLMITSGTTESKISQDKDNFTSYDANEIIFNEASFVSNESNAGFKINGDHVQNYTDTTFNERVEINSNITSKNYIKSNLSPNITSKNIEYLTTENNQNRSPTVLDTNGDLKIVGFNETSTILNLSNTQLHNFGNNNESIFYNKVVETGYTTIPTITIPINKTIREAANISGLTDILDTQNEDTKSTIITNYDTNITAQDIDNTDISKSTPVSSDNNITTITLKNENASYINSNNLSQLDNPLNIFLSGKENVSDSKSTTTESIGIGNIQTIASTALDTPNNGTIPFSMDTTLNSSVNELVKEPIKVSSKILTENSVIEGVLLNKVSRNEYTTVPNVTPFSVQKEIKEDVNILNSTEKYVTTALTNNKQTRDITLAVPNNYEVTKETANTNLQDINITNIFKPGLNSINDNIVTVPLKTYPENILQNTFQENTSTLLSGIAFKVLETTTASVKPKTNDFKNNSNTVDSKKIPVDVAVISNLTLISENKTNIFNKNALTPELRIIMNKSSINNATGPTVERQHHITVNVSTKAEHTTTTENLVSYNNTLKLFTEKNNIVQPNLITITKPNQLNAEVSYGELNNTTQINNITEISLSKTTNYNSKQKNINTSNNNVIERKSESNSTKETIKSEMNKTIEMPIVNDINVTASNTLSHIDIVTESVQLKTAIIAPIQLNNFDKPITENNISVSTEKYNINKFIAKTTENIEVNTTENPFASVAISELKNPSNVEITGADKITSDNIVHTVESTSNIITNLNNTILKANTPIDSNRMESLIPGSKDQNNSIIKPTDDTLLIVKPEIGDNVSITSTNKPYTFRDKSNDISIKPKDLEPHQNVDKTIVTFNLPENRSKENSYQDYSSTIDYSKRQMDTIDSAPKAITVNPLYTVSDYTEAKKIKSISNDTIPANYIKLPVQVITTISKNDVQVEIPTTHRPLSVTENSTVKQDSPLLVTESLHNESIHLLRESKKIRLPPVTKPTVTEQINSATTTSEPTMLFEDPSKINASQTLLENRTAVIHKTDENNKPTNLSIDSITEPSSIVETIKSDNYKYVRLPIQEGMKTGHIEISNVARKIGNSSTQPENKNNSQNLIGKAALTMNKQNMSLSSERQSESYTREELYIENKNASISPTLINIDIKLNSDKSTSNNNTSISSLSNNISLVQGEEKSSNPKFVIQKLNLGKPVNSMGSTVVEATVKNPTVTYTEKSTNQSKSNKHVINTSDSDNVKSNGSDKYFINQTNTKLNNLTKHNIQNEPNMTENRKGYSNSSINNIKLNVSEPVFNCSKYPRGKYADSRDCRKFYTCFGKIKPIVSMCPNHTVFSEINKQCTRNLSHCVRNNQFRCMYEGRFSDFLKNNIYYICVKKGHNGFLRYTLQCHSGYHLNKVNVKCVENEKEASESASSAVSGGNKSKRSSDKPSAKSKDDDKSSKKLVECKKEGKFPYPKDCKKYYVCSKNGKGEYRRKIKKCSSGKVYDRDDKKCVKAESTEC